MAAMRAVGPVLSLVGGAAVGLASVAHFSREPSLAVGVGVPAAAGIGLALFTIGYVFTIAKSRPYGRASTAFVVHASLMGLTATLLFFWLVKGGDLRVGAVIATILVAQIFAGVILLCFAGGSGRRVGPAFILSLLAFIGLIGASAFLTWKGW